MGAEPVDLQTLTQSAARPIQQDPGIGGGNIKFFADGIGIEFESLTHHENAAGLGWKLVDAQLQNVEKLLALQRLIRVSPVGRRLQRVPCGGKQGIYHVSVAAIGIVIGIQLHFALVAPQLIQQLMLEYPDDVGLERGLLLKTIGMIHHRQYGFRYRVFGQGFIAQLQRSKTQKLWPQCMSFPRFFVFQQVAFMPPVFPDVAQ
jgi:hypothetical protein